MALADATAELQEARDNWPDSDELTAAKYAANTIKPLMASVRAFHDAAERLIARGLYPYPTYHDLLFPHQHE
jgi:glutamine synthetase type III